MADISLSCDSFWFAFGIGCDSGSGSGFSRPFPNRDPWPTLSQVYLNLRKETSVSGAFGMQCSSSLIALSGMLPWLW